MNKILLISAVFIALGACTSLSNGSKKEVEQLNADWKKTTATLQTYSNEMEGAYLRCKALRDTMALPSGSMQRLSAADREAIQTILKNMTDYNDAFIDLGRALSPFFQQWQEKTERLSKLTIVVKNGNKLENQDIPTEIASLQAEVKNAESMIKKWSDELKNWQSKMEADSAQFSQRTATLQ